MMAYSRIHLLALLISVCQVRAGMRRGWRDNDRGHRGMGLGWDNGGGYRGYPKQNYDVKKAKSPTPRCLFRPTWVQIVVIGSDGEPCSNAVISLRDSKEMNKLISDENGVAKAVVWGCEISFLARCKDKEPEFKSVSFENNLSGKERIEVLLKPRCNFVIFLEWSYHRASHADDGSVAHYQYQAYTENADPAIETGSGLIAADLAPLCIHWEPAIDSGKTTLNLEIVPNTAADPTILHITRQEMDFAVVNFPPVITDNYKFLICFNIWDRDGDDSNDAIRIHELELYDSTGEVTTFDVHDDGNCFWFNDPLPDKDEDYLFAAIFRGQANGDPIDGNAYILDCNGKSKTVETPGVTYVSGKLWPFACFCSAAKTIKDVEVINAMGYEASGDITDSSTCDDIC
eukprot:TRINITY_DN10359_c0_g1_i5.p1 TRINITY_DN10359_c0_g1~~TRINITY_DN10359_c0_g1_i5.p1  ORF type:complete len:401 (-),score=60.74 TRINITY_DN10359_c0_g1_i5:23-1225(-)